MTLERLQVELVDLRRQKADEDLIDDDAVEDLLLDFINEVSVYKLAKQIRELS